MARRCASRHAIRLVTAGPDAVGERGSLPLSWNVVDAPPDRYRGRRGAFGVTRQLDLVLALSGLSTHGCWEVRRELNLARRLR